MIDSGFPRMTVSVVYDPSPEAQENLACMLGRGVHVTVWGAPDDYRLPDPIVVKEVENGTEYPQEYQEDPGRRPG